MLAKRRAPEAADAPSFFSGRFSIQRTEEESAVVEEYQSTAPSVSLSPSPPIVAQRQQEDASSRINRLYNIGALGQGLGALRVRMQLLEQQRAFQEQDSRIPDVEVISAERVSEIARRVKRKIVFTRFKNTIQKLECERLCARCRKSFTRAASLGRWQCRYHPGVRDESRGRYTCCSEPTRGVIPYDLQGCTPCDHTDRFNSRDGIPAIVIEEDLLPFLDPLEESKFYIELPRDHENEEPEMPRRWALGYLAPLRSKRDITKDASQEPLSGSATSIKIGPNMLDRDAMNVPRAKPPEPGFHVRSRFTDESLRSNKSYTETRHGVVVAAAAVEIPPKRVLCVTTASFDQHVFKLC